MAGHEALLAAYGRLLDPSPAGYVCFDRALDIIHASAPHSQLPLDPLMALADRVLRSGIAEYNVPLVGALVASGVPLGANTGVLCSIENPGAASAHRDLVMRAEDAVAVFDKEHELELSNAAWDALVARDAEVMALARSMLARVRDGATVDVDVVFEKHDVIGIARPFVSMLGATLGAMVAFRERSTADREAARSKARDALAEAQLASRQKDQFIATISHELRAPLATMLLWERVLRDESISAATRARALDAIHESAMAQSRLVGDLLDVSRAITGKLHVEHQPVAIADVIRAVFETATPSASSRQVTLAYEPDGAGGFVIGDAARLRQVFANLVTNALNCTGPGGRIVVSQRRTDTALEIVVADTGRGIEPDLLPHLFEPFRQGRDAAAGGLGLGLAIAHQLVTLHDGSITAASEGKGRGARFTVTLPIAQAPTSPRTSTRSPARLAGVRVLVVEDDPRVLDAIQIILVSAGAAVETASTAAAAVDAVDRARPDVVLGDLAMPDGDGCSMMRRIRARDTNARRIPAIAMTAHVAETNRRAALDAGFDRYLTKPLDVDQLITTLASLVPSR